MSKRTIFWYIWAIIRCLFGFGNIEDDSICWFSTRFFNVHDYHTHKGGDGTPSHFHTYVCPKCDKHFTI
jgi:hypothetical protein